MNSEHVQAIAVVVDRMILESRLRDLAVLAQSDRSDRLGAIAIVVGKLRPGAYLLGCGPYSCGVLPLTVDEIVLGRPPSPLEDIPDTVADFTLNDAVWLVPREASRIHAAIFRRTEYGRFEYFVRDANSRAGTFVNGTRVATSEGETPVRLASGDMLTLGPSGINCYVFVEVD